MTLLILYWKRGETLILTPHGYAFSRPLVVGILGDIRLTECTLMVLDNYSTSNYGTRAGVFSLLVYLG